MIIESQPEDNPVCQIILVFGGFQTQMGFLRTIGNLMSGTGLNEAIFYVYAVCSVDQMIYGKASVRAVKAHYLMDGKLNTIAASLMCGLKCNVSGFLSK